MKMGKAEKSLIIESYITRRKTNPVKEDNEKKKRKDSIRRVSLILRKSETLRTPEEKRLLESNADVAKQISKRKERIQLYKERVVEKEDSLEVIDKKAQRLAEIISQAKHLVCYTGAGISTSARIPDYRGSNGIWTLMQQGKDIGQHDLSLADPTFTHMALYELHRRKMLRYVVSQNCDGLHLRAGLPKYSLSEVHGNMYIEVCKHCKPNVEYWRLFDTTELTSRFYHKTNRRCRICGKPLVDTIVHFGERGILKWPLNWGGACHHSEKADVILCLGSSLKVLKKYSWLWQMDRSQKKRAKICIINLQWTPKDRLASVKINGKCDDIMKLVMKYLNINVPSYDRQYDPIFAHATLLCPEELHTVSQPMLQIQKEKVSGKEESEDDEMKRIDTITLQRKLCFRSKFKRPRPPIPIKKTPFVKTNLNSRHLILAEDTTSSSSDEEEEKIESEESFVSTVSVDVKTEVNESQLKQNEESHRSLQEVCNGNASNTPIKIEQSDPEKFPAPTSEIKHESLEVDKELCGHVAELSLVNATYASSRTDYGDITQNTPPNNSSPEQNTQIPIKSETASVTKSIDLAHCRSGEIEHSKISNCDISSNLLYNTSTKTRFLDSTTSSSTMLHDIKHTNMIHNALKLFRKHLNNGDESSEIKYDPFSLDKKALFDLNSVEVSNLASSDGHYRNFIEYCKVVDNKMPYWYDVDYAYSGLHSIIQPPPPDIDLWSSVTIPIFQMNRKEAECEFCFDNYAEYACQFYKKRSTDFNVKKYRDGKLILCECCDYSDDDGPHYENSTRRNEKRAKIDISLFNAPVKVQAGWYGKGCRKNFRKKKK